MCRACATVRCPHGPRVCPLKAMRAPAQFAGSQPQPCGSGGRGQRKCAELAEQPGFPAFCRWPVTLWLRWPCLLNRFPVLNHRCALACLQARAEQAVRTPARTSGVVAGVSDVVIDAPVGAPGQRLGSRSEARDWSRGTIARCHCRLCDHVSELVF